MSEIEAGDTCARCGKVVRVQEGPDARPGSSVEPEEPRLVCACPDGPTLEWPRL